MGSYSLQRIPKPSGPPMRGSYYTEFPLVENPISQGGIWIQRDPNRTKMQTIAGFSYGTETGNDGFNDSMAYQNGWGADYSIYGKVWIRGSLSDQFREVEIFLRCSDSETPDSLINHAYEINVAWDGAYANIGRYFGAALQSLGDNTPGSIGFTPATGDVFKCTAVGQLITAYWNDVQFMQVTDNDPTLKIPAGGPGYGAFVQNKTSGVSNDDFRWSNLTIIRL